MVYTRIAWSLCYEEQFYFVCFATLLLFSRRLYEALTALTVLVTLYTLMVWDSGGLGRLDGTFFVRWHQFAIGLAVYWRLNVASSSGARRGVELLLFGVLALSSVFRGVLRSLPIGPPAAIYDATAVSALFGLLLIALRPLDEPADRAAWLGPLRACGRRSYSIYLTHLPVCVVGNLWLVELGLQSFWQRLGVIVPLTSAAAVAVCWGFFALVEAHFLNPPVVRRAPSEPVEHPLAGEAVGPAS